ncbi:hypothetical protein [Shewanella algae]|uniref:hypothetical protein n=1 Tax=Shewanella algae TaxID=38313 RepID=UPI001AACEBE2|nr:hypothetical protein [Shewanella algae]MBO2601485.1 hypothetical protein [Shewanella algae]
MAKLNLSQAARATGKNRVTLWRHINAGKLSAERDREGNPFVDTSELIRVYGEIKHVATQLNTKKQHQVTPSYDELVSLLNLLRREQAEMKSIIMDLQNRLEFKPEKHVDLALSKAELDPEWPASIESLSDVLKRNEIKARYS